MKINIPNLVATLLLLFVFAGLTPLINTAVGMMAPNLGQFETTLAKGIPFFILLAILANLFESEEATAGVR